MGERASITVFEKEARIGGRVWSVEFAGLRMEAGGSLIHSSNRYMGNAVDMLGLTRSTPMPMRTSSNPTVGVWNGESFDFVVGQRGEQGAAFMAQRYGASLTQLGHVVQAMLVRLLTIYELQELGVAFDSPKDMMQALGLYELTQRDGYSFLRENRIGDPFMLEMSDGISRGNYGQAGHMNALATLVSLIGGGFGGGHGYVVREGVARVCEGLLARANARVLTEVPVAAVARRLSETSFAGDGSEKYVIVAEDGREFVFDSVIIAAPLEQARLQFSGVGLPHAARAQRAYQTTHVTFVRGRLNTEYFGLGPDDTAPTQVMTRENPDIPFSTLATMGSADGDRTVYKLFSRERLDDGVLDALFIDRAETERLAWQAYPVLSPDIKWPPFRLAPRMYYVNAMESPVSTMETEAMGARNVVNLLALDMGQENDGRASAPPNRYEWRTIPFERPRRSANSP